MTSLSVNINKIATLRNSRGGNIPNVVQSAIDCERFGAQGITVHPRPDERHIKYKDVIEIKQIITTELNIEGYPSNNFINLVENVNPHQVTLVPDSPDALTSNHGWDTIKNQSLLSDIIAHMKKKDIRVSIFIETNNIMIENAKKCGADRVELYTEPYAANYSKNREKAIASFITAAQVAIKNDLAINAGHDLNLENLQYLVQNIPQISEVSIGHALISDALYFGLENTIQMYLRLLR